MQIRCSRKATLAFGRAVPAISILLAFLPITFALKSSAAIGRLSLPPFFDDIGYFIGGFDLYTLVREKGFCAILIPLMHEHAPLQSLLAMTGDFLFGLGPWSAYLANGFLVIGLVLVLLILTRSLQPLARLSIILYVLSLPLIGNLVTEFRPDIFWGILSGIAIYLMLSPTFLRSRSTTCATAVVVGLALLAKPSASPATALLMGLAGLLAIWQQRPLRPFVKNLGIFVLLVLAMTGVYFAINAFVIYNYIHIGLVEQYGIFDDKNRSFLEAALYYIARPVDRVTLSTAFWLGVALFIWNSISLYWNGRHDDLVRYLSFGFVTFVAYLVPTVSPIKSIFFGSIFYGIFLMFTVRGLTLAFSQKTHSSQTKQFHSSFARVFGPALLILLTAITFPDWTLMSQADENLASTLNRAADQLTRALEKAVRARSTARPAIVFVSAPSPFSDANISLLARWHGLKMVGEAGYYYTSLNDERQHAIYDDYVLISQFGVGRFPGAKLGLTLLEWIQHSHDFDLLTDFAFPDGTHVYLFQNKRPR